MGNNLDKFIRSRIRDRQYEFKEDYWLEAEKMLERQDRNRSGRPFSLWFVFVLLGAFLMYLAYPVIDGAKDNKTQTEQDSFESPSAALTKDSEATLPGEVASPYRDDAGYAVRSNKQDGNDIATANVLNEGERSEVNGLASDQDLSTHVLVEQPGKADRSTNAETNTALRDNSRTNGSGSVIMPDIDGSPKAGTSNIASGQVIRPGINNMSLAGSDKQPGIHKSEFGFGSLDRQSAPLYQQDLSQGRDWFNMKLPDLEIRADLQEKRIKPRVHRYLFGGLAWSAISQAQGPFPAGLGAGINLNYKFQKRWSAHTDLFLYYRRGDFEPVKQSSVIDHDFGVKNSVYQMVPTGVIELTMPLYMRYHINKHGIEAGISIDYLLGMYGDIMVYSHESVPGTTNDDGVTITRQNDIQLDAGGLKRFDLHFMTGYHWHFAHNMSAGARIYFNPWSNRLGEPLPNIDANNVIEESRKMDDIYVENNPLRNLGNWTFGVDLRYYLFNNQNNRKYGRRR